jgi:hypothetical protein
VRARPCVSELMLSHSQHFHSLSRPGVRNFDVDGT